MLTSWPLGHAWPEVIRRLQTSFETGTFVPRNTRKTAPQPDRIDIPRICRGNLTWRQSRGAGMRHRQPLSAYPTARTWLDQFISADQDAAASLLNAMLLLSEEQVSAALRSRLYELASTRRGKHRRVALYAERELDGPSAFKVEPIPDASGRIRMRAVGRRGPPAVDPVRGSSRVGSEGLVAFVISQAKETWPKVFMNHPGPDLIRGKTRPAGSIGVVTDFIGSGSRVRRMLDAFWAVPSVRAWVSRGWIDFKVIAAGATAEGEANVRHHRLRPRILAQYVSPTIGTYPDRERRRQWHALINAYGPGEGRGTGRYGFCGSASPDCIQL